MSTFVVGDVHGRRKQLAHLLSLLPREAGRDTLVLLGDLIDRGEDIVGTVADVLELQQSSPEGSVVTLRGNHEQMLLEFIDEGAPLWLHPAVGGQHTFGQYTGYKLNEDLRSWWEEAQRRLCDSLGARQRAPWLLPAESHREGSGRLALPDRPRDGGAVWERTWI